ncbi:MAG: hypothetical protein POELPBGB_02788 [Bacteroidia bacterium]|nr:hypothetical protein [Bacteroidia bacterium]
MKGYPNRFERSQPLTDKVIYVAAVSVISVLAVLSVVSIL